MTVAELKIELVDRGLHLGGRKADLDGRLLQHIIYANDPREYTRR